MKATHGISASLLLAASFCGVFAVRLPVQDGTQQIAVVRCVSADDLVIRFYYNPMINEPSLSPGPLILLPVSSQDPQVDTKAGWVLRLTLSNLRGILRSLNHANLEWKESELPRQLVVSGFDLPHPHHDSMEVAISCPSCSASAEIKPNQVCGILSKLSENLNAKAREAVSFYSGTVSCPSTAQGGPDRIDSR